MFVGRSRTLLRLCLCKRCQQAKIKNTAKAWKKESGKYGNAGSSSHRTCALRDCTTASKARRCTKLEAMLARDRHGASKAYVSKAAIFHEVVDSSDSLVPRSLLLHYCPRLQPDSALPGQPIVLETNRPFLTLLSGSLYTGKIDSSDWYTLM
ncbi:hypothetical protein KCU93_g368, partial [Aureobasidium melanogenum]